MKRTIVLRLAVGVLTVVALTNSCARRPKAVVVGIGLTADTRAGIQLAAREINAQGGIDGVPLQVVGMEWPGGQSRFDPQLVIRWANRFAATEGLLGVIGHSDSASTLSAAAIYNRHGIPQIVTIATNPAITNIGQWTYRLCLSDAAQGPALADYVVQTWQKRRIAMFYVNDDYGRGLAQRFEGRVKAIGGSIVQAVMHRNVLQADDRETIEKSIAELARSVPAPDLVVLFQRNDAANFTMTAMRDAKLAVDVLGGDTLAQLPFLEQLPELKEGMRVSQFFRLAPGSSRAQQFAKNFAAYAGRPPDYSQAFTYDAVYLFRDAVKNGGFTRAGVKRYLDGLIAGKTEVAGVGGSFLLGPDHDARRPLYIAAVRQGRLEVLQPLRVN